MTIACSVFRSRNPGAWRPRRLVVLAVLNLAAAACAQRPVPGTRGGNEGKAASFAEFASRFTGDSLALSPPSATLAGLHRHRDPETGREIDLDRELDDVSAEGTAGKARYYRGTLEALDRDFEAESLPEQERIDRGIIASQCRLALLDLEKVRSFETNPTAAVESIGTALFFPVVFEYAPAADRGADVLARLQKLPTFADGAIAALRSSAPIYTEVAIEENDGNRDVIQNALPALYEKGSDLEARLRKASGPALLAIDRLGRFLREDLKKRTTSGTPDTPATGR